MNKDNSAIESVKNFKPKSDFIEKNILIPVINQQIEAISSLFDKMKEICSKLQNENSKESQQYIKNFESSIHDYYIKKFGIQNHSSLFIEVKKIYSKLQNENTENIQQHIEDFESFIQNYYITKYAMQSNKITCQAKKLGKMLLNGIYNHLIQYTDVLKKLKRVSPEEDNIEQVEEYMIKTKSLMSNLIQLKNKIFSIILPMTTLEIVNQKTGEVIKSLHLDSLEGKVTKIGLLPFETMLDEIALLCENGISSIDSWFNHLKNKKIQHIENIVNQSKVQAAQEQAKAAKWTFFTQIGVIILSLIFILVSIFFQQWINFFTNKQNINKPLVETGILPKQPKQPSIKEDVKKIPTMNKKTGQNKNQPLKKDKPKNIKKNPIEDIVKTKISPIDKDIKKTEKVLTPNKEQELKEVQSSNKKDKPKSKKDNRR